MKKSLIFWFAAVTCAALFLVGCESPTNGDAGAAGTDGPYPLTDAAVDADALKAAFYVSSRVAITDGSGGIDGEVPAGKTLYVLGTAKVTSAKSLTVKGTLDIYEEAALDASYTGTVGYLATSGGAITGTGTVSLPYIADGVTDGPTGIVTYGNSPGSITKTAGSYIAVSAASPGSALDTGDLSAIFGVVGELTVGSLTTPLVATAIPANKTLTVNGAASIGATLDLTGKGALVIGKTGTLTVSGDYNITGNATAGIVIEGTLSVGGGVTVNKVDLSNANVTNSEAKTLTLTKGASAVVIGKITPVASNALTIAGSDSGTTVYIKEIAGVSGSAAVTFGANSVLAIPQDESLTIGEGSGISVTNANYALTTANLAKLKGKVEYTGAVTGIAETLVVPAGVELDVSTAGTLATITGLTVDGTLTASKATLAQATSLTVGQDASLTAGEATGNDEGIAITVDAGGSATVGTIAKLLAPSSVAAGGTLTATAITAFDTEVELEVGAGGTVNGIVFPAATAISALAANALTIGDLTVPAGATLTVPASTTLKLDTGKSLVLTGAAATGGAKLAGEGKVVAAKTEITGGESGDWQAVGTGTVTIEATNANASSITASAYTVTLTAMAAGAVITQAVGASNALTIAAATTVALGGDGAAVGSIVLKSDGSNPGKLVFADVGSSDVGTSLVTTAATSSANKVTGTVSAPSTGTALVWYAANATTGGKWSKVGASNSTNGLVGGSDADVTLSGESTVTASA